MPEETLMAEAGEVAMYGGAGTLLTGILFQAARIWMRDKQGADIHERANKATDGLFVRVESLQAENKGLHDQVADLNRQVGTLEGKVSALLMTVENLTKGYARIKAENTKLRGELGQPPVDISWATGDPEND
jgi:hypothetical protein